jgi:hypothetical protein
MKLKIRWTVVFLALTCVMGPAAFAATFSLTGGVAQDFTGLPTAEQAIQTLSANSQPLWGLGWEVVLRNIGFGGTYLVNFTRDAQKDWQIDWYGQALFISYHLLGGSAFIDPFIQTGLGCAGRESLVPGVVVYDTWGNYFYESYPLPDISIFPFLTAGLTFHLDAFTIGAKLTYVPFNSGIPVTDIPTYPLGSFQVVVFTGMTFGH